MKTVFGLSDVGDKLSLTTLRLWFYDGDSFHDGDSFPILLTESLCWSLFRYVGDVFLYVGE